MGEPKARDWVKNWPKVWTPRSLAYREGFQAGFDNKGALRFTTGPCPYQPGSAEFDAWFAGRDHGVHRWKCAQDGTVPEVGEC